MFCHFGLLSSLSHTDGKKKKPMKGFQDNLGDNMQGKKASRNICLRGLNERCGGFQSGTKWKKSHNVSTMKSFFLFFFLHSEGGN